jgi:hypothetical protein
MTVCPRARISIRCGHGSWIGSDYGWPGPARGRSVGSGALLGEPQHLHRVRDRRRSVGRAETQLAVGVSNDRADPA